MENRLFFGDNLDVLRENVADESVDLIYLDPPFNSDARYNVLFRSSEEKVMSAQAEAFRDTWTWNEEAEWAFTEVAKIGGTLASFVGALHGALGRSDLMAYLVMMSVRLHELRRVLKREGSLYLHCDPTASHYLKVLLDGVFGADKFRNEIVWKRTGAHGHAKRWGPIHDTILFYTASSKYCWNRVFQPYDPGYLERHYSEKDERGFFQPISLTGSGVRGGESGLAWRGVNPTEVGRHWAVPERGIPSWFELPDGYIMMGVLEKLDVLDLGGLIWWPRRGAVPRFKRYSDVAPGNPIQDIVSDIGPLSAQSAERLGYPTQKPVALLRRIIEASTSPGDVVLDPFCGCGTTVHAAKDSGRRWFGVDIAYHAIEVISDRLKKHFDLEPGRDYLLSGIPNDLLSAHRLAERDKYQFQWWANYLVGVQQMREVRRGRDQGIDGEIFFAGGPGRGGFGRILTSVKGGRNVGVSDLRDFRGVLERENADGGLFVCLRRPTRDMRQNAASAGFFSIGASQYPRLQIVSIEEWYEDGVRPVLPTMAHLARRRDMPARPMKKPRVADKRQAEMLLSFPGESQDDARVHINPRTAYSQVG